MPNPTAYREIARYCRRLLKERTGDAGSELSAQLQQWAVECDNRADRDLGRSLPSARLERARRYRMRAEEYRAVLDQLSSPAARASYEHLAQSYEAMATQLENLGIGSPASGEQTG
ncbi:MAG TPA: hypothetical protein VN668_12620 [Stellaceae bacterium]|nr:hypothetical protein [Stellaceae bacterium]